MLGGMLELRKVLTSELVKQVLFMSDELGTPQSSILFLVAWYFLLRVEAEAIPLEAGDESALMQLPPERHSSVWIDAAGQLCIRWTRRKQTKGRDYAKILHVRSGWSTMLCRLQNEAVII